MPARRSPQRSSARTPSRTSRSRRPPPTSGRRRRCRARSAPRPGSDRSFLWRWRRGLFMVGLVVVATTGGVAAVVFNIELPPEESLLQTSFVCAADVTEACGPDNAIATFSAEEDRTNVQLDEVPGRPAAGRARHRGPGLLRARRHRPGRHRSRALPRHPGHGRHPGRLDDHPAVRQERLPHLRAQHRPQGEGGGARGEARARAQQGRDPRALPQHHLLRPRRLRRERGRRARTSARTWRTSACSRRPTSPASSARRAAPTPSRTRRRPPAGGAPCSTRWPRRATSATRSATSSTPSPIETGVVVEQDRQGLGRVEGNTADDNIGTKYFVEAVRRQIAEQYGEDVLYGGGLRIYTTLDFDMQRAAWDAVTSTLDQPTDPGRRARRRRPVRLREGDGRRPRLRDRRGEPRPRRRRPAARGAAPARRSSRSCSPRPSARTSR